MSAYPRPHLTLRARQAHRCLSDAAEHLADAESEADEAVAFGRQMGNDA